ncbi:MAG: hypothetical protein ABIY50_11245 [Ignavibacteria bacterium]
MIKSSAISILKTFSGDEVKRFDDFLNSPFHNTNENVITLYRILKNYHPHYDNENLSKETLFKGVFGKTKFKEFHMRNLLSDLNIHAEKFLLYVHVNENFTDERLIIEELNKRNIRETMEKRIRLMEKKLNSAKSKDHEYYTNRVFIFEAKSFLIVDKTLTDNFRAEQMSSTIKLFMISIMEFYFYLIVEEQRVRIKHDFDFLKLMMSYFKDHIDDFKESPLLLIFYHLLLSFFDKDNDEKYFFKSKELFSKHFSTLTKVDQKNVYSVLQTYCINKIDDGFENYNKELLNILLEMLKFNLLSHKSKDVIDINLFRNILILCVTLKEVGILKKFIRGYIKYIETKSRNSVTAYSFAHLNFLQKDFEKCMEYCNKINFSDFLLTTNENLYFKNDTKKLMLLSLYELNSLENALSLIDTHKHFIKNSRLIKDNSKKKYMNFLNNVNDLIKLRINFDEYDAVKLKEKVLQTKELINKDWILEKLNQLNL